MLYRGAWFSISLATTSGVCVFFHIFENLMYEHSCPFCNNRRYMTVYTGPLSKEERDLEDREEKKVQDLRAKMLQEEATRKDSGASSPTPQLTSSTSSIASSPASPLSASSPYSSERKDSASVPAPAPPPPGMGGGDSSGDNVDDDDSLIMTFFFNM